MVRVRKWRNRRIIQPITSQLRLTRTLPRSLENTYTLPQKGASMLDDIIDYAKILQFQVKEIRVVGNFIAQVDGYSDHYSWELVEDMSTPRTVYKLNYEHSGSEFAGETVAAAAITSKP